MPENESSLPRSRATKLRQDWQHRPHPSRLSPESANFDDVMRAHISAVANGGGGYEDPETGLFVLTAVYLRDQGSCCDRKCRHCPYVGAD